MFTSCVFHAAAAILFCSVLQPATCVKVSALQLKGMTILDNILKDYDPRIHPIDVNSTGQYLTAEPPVLVSVNLYVLDINDVDDKAMDYSLTMYLRQEWYDDRLQFNDERGSISFLPLFDVTKIWTPDLFVTNEKTGFLHKVLEPNQFLRIYPSGHVLFSSRLSVTASCPMNLRWFPFDRPSCQLQLESYGWSTKDVKFQWKAEKPVLIADTLSQTTHSVDSIHTDSQKVKLEKGEYMFLRMTIHFRRLINPHIVYVFIPSAMLVMVSWCAFWLHHSHVTARVALDLSCLLVLASHVAVYNASLATVSYTKSLDVWTGVCLTFIFAALCETMTVINFADVIAQEKLLSGQCNPLGSGEGGHAIPLVELGAASAPANSGQTRKPRTTYSGIKITDLPTWSEKLDSLSCVAFPAGFAAFVVVYWLANLIHYF